LYHRTEGRKKKESSIIPIYYFKKKKTFWEKKLFYCIYLNAKQGLPPLLWLLKIYTLTTRQDKTRPKKTSTNPQIKNHKRAMNSD